MATSAQGHTDSNLAERRTCGGYRPPLFDHLIDGRRRRHQYIRRLARGQTLCDVRGGVEGDLYGLVGPLVFLFQRLHRPLRGERCKGRDLGGGHLADGQGDNYGT